MSQRILVTGAQDVLGRTAIARWLAEWPDAALLGVGSGPREDRRLARSATWGDRMVAAPVPDGLRGPLEPERYRYERLDLLDRPILTRTIQRFRPTRVLHLAEALRDEPAGRLFRRNVEATATLIEAVEGSGVPKPLMLFGSSGGIYGHTAEATLPLCESDPAEPADLYSASKLAAENVSAILCGRYGIPLVRVRVFNAVGPGLDERHFCGRVAAQVAAIAEGIRAPVIEVGALSTTRDFIDVRDVAAAIVHLADERFAGRVFNVAGGQEVRIGDLLDLFLGEAGLEEEVEIRRLPARPGDLPRHYASIEELERTGFRPEFGLRDSVDRLIEYYRKEVRTAAGRPRGEGERNSDVLRVSATQHHRYEVVIEAGAFSSLPDRLRARFPAARMVVLSDSRVAELYAGDLVDRMRAADLRATLVTVPAGEASKSFETYRGLIGSLRECEFDRRAVLVNVGGGLVTDLGGFVAATYMRGVAYVNVPTTLLAQHDAATGGKVAVNTAWAKNFVGAFHHPCVVFVDPGLLATLDDRDLAGGVAEAAKVAITGDATLFETLEQEVEAIRVRRDPEILASVVRRATARKIALLAPDPYEVDLRRALNLGHTFGHPLETECAYTGIRHGEAVAYGIGVATEIARARGRCEGAMADRIHRLLEAYGLPPAVSRRHLRAAGRRLGEIRLIRAGRLHFVLPRGTAAIEIVDEVSDAEVQAAIEAMLRRPLRS